MSNSLAEVHPELVSEWSEKNLPQTQDTLGSKRSSFFGVCLAAHVSAGFNP